MRGALSPPALLLAATAVLVGAALFRGGAAGDGSVVWIGGAAVLAAAVATAAAVFGRARFLPALDPPARAALGLLVAFTVWNGLSIWWSSQPSRSWDSFNRSVAYVALACLAALAVAAAPRPLRTVALGLAALLGLVLAWALLGKIVPALGADPRIARLRTPVGYWNQLALLADGAVALGLWLCAGGRRAAGVLLLYLAFVAVVLTYSRSGIALAALVALGWLVVRPGRAAGLVALAVAGAPAAVAVGVAFALPGVSRAAQPHGGRVHDGLLFGVAVVVLGVAAVVAGRWALARRIEPGVERRLVRLAALLALGAVVVGLAGAVVASGGPQGFARARWHEFTSPSEFSNGPTRLGEVSSGGRWQWWKEAWGAFLDHPAGGTGAGTFQLSDRLRRHSAVTTIEPHNTALQFLSETGIVGLGLWLGGAVAAAVAFRRRRYEDPGAAAALGLVALAFFLHSLGDIDWSFLATQAPLFAILGALLAAGTPVLAPRPSRLRAPAAVLVGLGLVYSLAAPWLAARKLNSSFDAFDRGNYALAAAEARAARGWNPLSVPAVTQQALAEEGRGDRLDAYALYIHAVGIEPLNPDTWFDLGIFQLKGLKNARAAYDSFNRAYTLDRYGPSGLPGGLLDQARCRAFRHGPNCPGRARGAHP